MGVCCSFTNRSFSSRTDYSSPVDVLCGRSFGDGCSVADNPDFSFISVLQRSLPCVSISNLPQHCGTWKDQPCVEASFFYSHVWLLFWLMVKKKTNRMKSQNKTVLSFVDFLALFLLSPL